MLHVFEDVHANRFVRSSAQETSVEEQLANAVACPGSLRHGEVVALGSLPRVTATCSDGSMDLRNVPIITPSGDVVCPSLTLKIKPGTHFLITGDR